jgi:hypothetical protein
VGNQTSSWAKAGVEKLRVFARFIVFEHQSLESASALRGIAVS